MHPVWVDWCGLFDDVDKNDAQALATKIDELFRESLQTDERTGFMDALAMVGAIRGGSSFAGSIVWADIHEYDKVEGCFTQVFGHTAQKNSTDGTWDGPYSVGNNICVDCGVCFYLDDEGLLRFLDADRAVRV